MLYCVPLLMREKKPSILPFEFSFMFLVDWTLISFHIRLFPFYFLFYYNFSHFYS